MNPTTIAQILGHADQRQTLIGAMEAAFPRHCHSRARDVEGDGFSEISFISDLGDTYRSEIALRVGNCDAAARVTTWSVDSGGGYSAETDAWGNDLEVWTPLYSSGQCLADVLAVALDLATEQRKDLFRKVLGEDGMSELYAD